MIIVTVAGKVKPQFRQTFLEHMEVLGNLVREEKGCLNYQQTISADDPDLLFLYEEWNSQEELLVHLQSEHMQAHLSEARPWFEWVDMKTYEAEGISLV